MAAINGCTETSYYAFRDFHDYSSLVGAYEGEYEFMSGENGQPLTWKQYMDYILRGQQYPSDESIKKTMERVSQELESKNSNCNTPRSVWEVIRTHPRLQKFTNMLASCNYRKINTVEYPVTILAPIDDLFDFVMGPTLFAGVYSLQALQAARYHTLPYYVNVKDMIGQKLYLETDLEKQRVIADFTGDRHRFINPITRNFFDPINNYNTFPRKAWEVEVLETIECAGGTIFLIDRPLLFPKVL